MSYFAWLAVGCLIPLVALNIHRHLRFNPSIRICIYSNSGWATEDHLKVDKVPVFENVVVFIPSMRAKYKVFWLNGKEYLAGTVNERVVWSYGTGDNHLRFARRNDGYSLPGFGGRGAKYSEWILQKYTPVGSRNPISRGSPAITKLHPGLQSTIGEKPQFGTKNDQIGPQLFLGGIAGNVGGLLGRLSLPLEFWQSTKCCDNAKPSYSGNKYSNAESGVIDPVSLTRHGSRFNDRYGILCICGGFVVGFILWMAGGWRLFYNQRDRLGLCMAGSGLVVAGISFTSVVIGCLPGSWHKCLCDGEDHSDNRQTFQHNTENVSQKLLTLPYLRITLNTAGQDMANLLGTDKKIAVIAALTEGSSIRSIERMTGVHRDTIMRLGVKVGQGCTGLMDETMRNLPCTRLEMDEIWGFVGKERPERETGRQSERGQCLDILRD